MKPRDLSAHSEYVPGRGVEEVARDLGVAPEELIKLSSNENPHGPSPDAVAAAREAVAEAHVYPKAAHTDLTTDLAERWNVTDEQVWVSPGADGALDYLARTALEPGDRVLVPEPGFAYYAMSARYHHGTVASYGLDANDEFAQTADRVLDAYDGERIVYVTSPHNPTGTEMPREELERLLDAVESTTLVVVDEAYGEFTDAPSAVDLLAEYDNLAVTRTFSKAYGLAGLRIGYAVVPESWADAYARINTPFAANAVALAAARAALTDDDHVAESVESAQWAREYMSDRLAVPTVESAANFVLAHVGGVGGDGDVSGGDGDGSGGEGGVSGGDGERAGGEAVAEAAQERGVIVRDTGSFGLPNYVRVSCGTREETEEAVETLNEVFADLDVANYDPDLSGGEDSETGDEPSRSADSPEAEP